MQDQIDALEERLVDALTRGYPEETAAMGLAGTRAFVHRTVETALDCGLDTEDSIARLSALRLQVGEQFERSPDRARALARLRHPTLPASLKIEMVETIIFARTQGRVVVPVTPER